jgi:hypothetical protein
MITLQRIYCYNVRLVIKLNIILSKQVYSLTNLNKWQYRAKSDYLLIFRKV